MVYAFSSIDQLLHRCCSLVLPVFALAGFSSLLGSQALCEAYYSHSESVCRSINGGTEGCRSNGRRACSYGGRRGSEAAKGDFSGDWNAGYRFQSGGQRAKGDMAACRLPSYVGDDGAPDFEPSVRRGGPRVGAGTLNPVPGRPGVLLRLPPADCRHRARR